MNQQPSIQYNRNVFTGLPVEFLIPTDVDIVFVSDFFVADVQGGAELTLEALIKASNTNVAKIHCNSLTPELLEKYPNKHYVIGNFATLSHEIVKEFITGAYTYSIVEFDFKFCMFRSMYRHMLETKQPCNCSESEHGKTVNRFYKAAKNLFWMSERQKSIILNILPDLVEHPSSHVISSMFEPETIKLLAKLRARTSTKDNKCAILEGGSWIKGTEQTEKWCIQTKKPYVKIGAKPYKEFLADLAKYETFVFKPLDYDTCPRVVIEAKLLGMKLELNDNVLHSSEHWFQGSIEDIENYLSNNASFFWNVIQPK